MHVKETITLFDYEQIRNGHYVVKLSGNHGIIFLFDSVGELKKEINLDLETLEGIFLFETVCKPIIKKEKINDVIPPRMDFEEFQELALKSAIYPNIGNNIVYPSLGLAGEAGEVSNKVKKIFRDNNGILSREASLGIGKELGDVLWYVAAMCKELNLDMTKVAIDNIKNLNNRKERGTLKGSGDNR